MKASETRAVMEALGRGDALFVGGCVRNALLGQPVDDIDIVSILRPDEVTKKLEAVGIKVIPTGIDHGTVTAVASGKPFEITTLRKDVETDGRHAVIEFSTDWAEDARRRDFTMNTLLMDLEGNIYDPLGCGLEDLRARRVVFVGDPRERIAEDHLRILRYFRFHALYSAGLPDKKALSACRAASDKIAGLSKERITQEFFKILSVDNQAEILALMFDNGILLPLIQPSPVLEYPSPGGRGRRSAAEQGEGGNMTLLKNLCHFQKNYGLVSIAARLLVLAGFAEEVMQKSPSLEGGGKGEGIESNNIEHPHPNPPPQGGEDSGDVMNRIASLSKFLLIPKVFRKDMQAIYEVLKLPDLSNDHAVKVAVYKHGRIPTAQALMIELALDRVMNGYAPQAVKIIQNWDIPDFPITGEDLIKQGFKPGPELGAELSRREEAWIKVGFKS